MSTQNKIMVVDDDPVNRQFFQLMLSKLGFFVEEASDGVDAMGKLKKFSPDLILLDNVMPRMTGFEFTKKLKDDTKYRDIPIIMFSALDDVKDKLTGFELGVDDYITKPFNFSEVLARIKAALRNRELLTQIMIRESRLKEAEDLVRDLQERFTDLTRNIDNSEKVREYVEELNARIAKTLLEWEAFKKNEIGISTLETHIRKFLNQESR